jgi:hypothetical protein
MDNPGRYSGGEIDGMGVKDHSGPVHRVKTWMNGHGEFELTLHGEEGRFLYQFIEESDYKTASEALLENHLYAITYEVERNGQSFRVGGNMIYVLVAEDMNGDAHYIEIGPDGYMNPATYPASRLVNDVRSGTLIPLKLASGLDIPIEDMIPAVRKRVRHFG